MAQGIDHGIRDCRRRAYRRRFADSLCTERMVRRRRYGFFRLPAWRLERGRHVVVDETAAGDVAVLVVTDLLEQRRPNALGQSAMDLAVDDHRVDDVAAVVHGYETPHLDFAGAAIDVDHADVAAE